MNPFSNRSLTVSLEVFEGPIDFLWNLIQKNEIDICQIPLLKIFEQFLSFQNSKQASSLEVGAEFVGLAASLAWIKSRALLPKEEYPPTDASDSSFNSEMLQHLIEYCQFKEIAKELTHREERQALTYARGQTEIPDQPKNSKIELLPLEQFAALFRQVMAKAQTKKTIAFEEVWRVSDKIQSIQNLVETKEKVLFHEIFSFEKSKEELIVSFLAVLELMKMGTIQLIQDSKTQEIYFRPSLKESIKNGT